MGMRPLVALDTHRSDGEEYSKGLRKSHAKDMNVNVLGFQASFIDY